jgi:hypothetical protein
MHIIPALGLSGRWPLDADPRRDDENERSCVPPGAADRPGTLRLLRAGLIAVVLLGTLLTQAMEATPAQAAHPQTITNAAGLSHLRAVRTGSHRWLADVMKRTLDRYKGDNPEEPYPSAEGVGGYAIAAQVFNDPSVPDAPLHQRGEKGTAGDGPRDPQQRHRTGGRDSQRRARL